MTPDELGKHLKMWFLNLDWRSGFRAVLKQKQVSQPWTYRATKGPFTIGRPNIDRASNCFLNRVVEVVPERMPHLAFKFHHSQQFP